MPLLPAPDARSAAPADAALARRDGLPASPAGVPFNAGPGHALPGLNDDAVVGAWLAEYARKPNTQRAYRREAGRFLRWLRDVRGATLADLGRLDFDDYRDFLAEPPDDWVLDGLATGGFRGGLSATSQRQALLILQSLFDYLMDGDYLRRNPLRLMKDKGPPPRKRLRPVPSAHAIERALGLLLGRLDAAGNASAPDALAALRPQTGPEDAVPDRAVAAREALAFGWLYWTACRRAELADARLGDLQAEPTGAGPRWWWQLTGKGDVHALLPLPAEAVALLARVWRQSDLKALADLVRRRPDAPLMLAGTERAATSVSAVYESLRASAGWLAAHPALADLDAQERELIAQLRPHSMRRARCTHLLDAGVEPRLVQRFLRHASLDTTLIYDQTGRGDFHAAISAAAPRG
ncbi:tyrosine-type recombinase/integrase [Derxia gummosa]|uniref:Tyrosine-type recombinase/integrase n=1 Tax=Derxia gummosa DSM 723 TaxID=1121388 RepID=A0A8B6X9G9_9BURK|nr:tyrosine-type recombinase/integrase [Derxia gummosa]